MNFAKAWHPQPSALSHQPSALRSGAHQGRADLHPYVDVPPPERHQADATREYRRTGGTSHCPLARRAGGQAQGGKSYIVGHQTLAPKGGKSYKVGHLHIMI